MLHSGAFCSDNCQSTKAQRQKKKKKRNLNCSRHTVETWLLQVMGFGPQDSAKIRTASFGAKKWRLTSTAESKAQCFDKTPGGFGGLWSPHL